MSAPGGPEAAACLGPQEVLDFVGGAVDAARRLLVEEHIDECEDCRRVVAAEARGSGEPRRAPTGDLRGVVLRRYAIRERLGAGGMGVVYLADDERLGRPVAIKLIRADADAPADAAARMLREAQAMAMVSHPNVVPVYDVGTYDGSLYVAMEYLAGGDLRRWLRERRREPAEIVDVFVRAARGLGAAHAAGLIHRDFKPANVALGNGGQVKVADFGLARAAADRSVVRAAALDWDVLGSPLTHTGTALGTPRYMSPEQIAGRGVDARSDQYSFCVALWEALTGRTPDGDRTVTDWRKPTRPPPARVMQVLRRGLSPDPGDRFASMEELIAALAPRRSRAGALVAAVSLAALAVAGGLWLSARDGSAAAAAATTPVAVACDSDAKAAAIWNPRRRAVLASVFATEPALWSAAERRIDELARDWRQAHAAACGEQAPDAPAMQCLARRYRRLAATLERLALMRADDLSAAPGLLAGLESSRACLDEAARRADPVPPTADIVGELVVARQRISKAEALLDRAPPDAATLTALLDDAHQLMDDVEELSYPPIYAEATLHHGRLHQLAGEHEDAAEAFDEAAELALRSNAVRVRGSAYAARAELARALGDAAGAERWTRAATRARGRLGESATGGPLDAAALRSACEAPDDLVLHLAFDEDSGLIAHDSSGHQRRGTLAGPGEPRWVDGRLGNALDLAGLQVDLGSDSSLDDLTTLTMCAWIHPRSHPSATPIIADKSRDTSGGGWNFFLEKGGAFGFLTRRRHWATAGVIRLGVWQHICASWDGSNGADGIALHRDGAQRPQRDSGQNGTGRDSDANRHLILGRGNDGSRPFDGLIDDYQLYRRVLSADEIAGIYDCSLRPGPVTADEPRRLGAPGQR